MPTASQLPMPRAVFYDANANPLAAGLVYTYIAGTTTPKQSWQDAGETTPNTNPVVLDANGSCLLYGSGIYTFQVTDALGNNVPAYSGLTTALSNITNFPTIASLRSNTVGGLAIGSIYVEGYSTAGDGGEGTFVFNPTDSTSADNGGTIIVDAAGNRWYRDVGTGAVSLKWFGAKGDGSTNDAPILTTAFAAANEVWVPPSANAYLIGTAKTIPSGKLLRFVSGAFFSIAGGTILTVNGLLEAPRNEQIFIGAGSVIGMRTVYPEWWGAKVNNAGFDSQPALQAAANAVQFSASSDGGRPTVYLGAGTYYINNTWGLSPSANSQLRVAGEGTIFNGTRIQTMATFPAVPAVNVIGNSDPTQCIADWIFEDVGILNGASSLATVGLQVGSTSSTLKLIGLQESRIEDIFINAFPIGLEFVHVRLININRTSIWNDSLAIANTCLLITENGGFTGDLTFNDCQWVTTQGTNRTGLQIQAPVGPFAIVSGQATCCVAGIRFNGCIGYSGFEWINITTAAGARITDVWFNPGCQFDSGATAGIIILSTGTGSWMEDIHFDGVFIDGSTADLLTFNTTSSGTMLNCWVSDCWLSQATARAIVLSHAGTAMTGMHIMNNTIMDCGNTAGTAISIVNPTYFNCSGNIATRSGVLAFTNLINISGASDAFVATGNIAFGVASGATVADTSTGTHKAIANNV